MQMAITEDHEQLWRDVRKILLIRIKDLELRLSVSNEYSREYKQNLFDTLQFNRDFLNRIEMTLTQGSPYVQ